jgi:hypothetical protein
MQSRVNVTEPERDSDHRCPGDRATLRAKGGVPREGLVRTLAWGALALLLDMPHGCAVSRNVQVNELPSAQFFPPWGRAMQKTIECVECKKNFQIVNRDLIDPRPETRLILNCPWCQSSNEIDWPTGCEFFMTKVGSSGI